MTQTARVIRVAAFGGPENMTLDEVSVGEPGPGEIRIRHQASGINFIDVYHRSGIYPNALPLALGAEGAGIVEAVGEGVTHLKPGDRAAYAANVPGSYSTLRVMPARTVVRLPESIDFDTGAAMMLKGLTVQYLLRKTLPVGGLQPGDFVLFHAAAGGVGLIACQWARHLGLKLIGTAGSDEKCELARQHGAAHVINYRREDFAARVKELTEGRGVKVVYDSVGADTWAGSLACLSTFGLMVSFGNASGVVPPVNLSSLSANSLYLTRPVLFAHLATRESTQAMADDLFDVVGQGVVRIPIGQRYALAEVQQAHRELEARTTTGSGLLVI